MMESVKNQLQAFASMTKSIFGVVDVQYLLKDGKSIPRILAIETGNFSANFEIKTGITDQDMSPQDRKTNEHLSQLMGYSLDVGPGAKQVINQDDVRTILTDMYRVMETTNKVFGVKNQQLARDMTNWGIPFVNLEDPTLGVPKWASIKIGSHTEQFYVDSAETIAHRKVRLLCLFVASKQRVAHRIGQIDSI